MSRWKLLVIKTFATTSKFRADFDQNINYISGGKFLVRVCGKGCLCFKHYLPKGESFNCDK